MRPSSSGAPRPASHSGAGRDCVVGVPRPRRPRLAAPPLALRRSPPTRGPGVIAMTHVGYLAAGWGIGMVSLAAYGLWTVRRGRSLAARVPPEERRWS